MASTPSPSGLLSYLTGPLGYSTPQAAAIVGNIEQESGFNPNSLNKGEGAYGLLQWRGPRLEALKQFAAANGSDPSDWRTQLNFTKYEMSGSERNSAAPFLAANSVPAANTALHGYIRYGDSSEGRRLQNAENFLPQQYAGVNSPPLTPGSAAPPLPPPINVGSVPNPVPFMPLAAAAPQLQQQQPQFNPMALAGLGGAFGQQQTSPPPQFPSNPVQALALSMPPPSTQGLQQLIKAPVLRGLLS